MDTLVLTLSKNQDAKNLQQIPDNRGSTLYRLLTDPDNVNLEYLSADLFAVRIFNQLLIYSSSPMIITRAFVIDRK